MPALPERPGTTGDDAAENASPDERGPAAVPTGGDGANGDGLIRPAEALAVGAGSAAVDADADGADGDSPDDTDDADEFDRKPEERRSRRAVRSLVEWAVVILGALLVAFLVKTFLLQAFWIPSPSMEPTLQRDDRVLANKLADGISDLNRGDVIVFRRVDDGLTGPDSDVNDLIKRVIGLPGDVVEARDGVVYVNNQRLDEPYLESGTRTDRLERIEVPEGHVFVLGDNRGNSQDSRTFGPVPDDNIVGRAWIRIWPPGRIGRL